MCKCNEISIDKGMETIHVAVHRGMATYRCLKDVGLLEESEESYTATLNRLIQAQVTIGKYIQKLETYRSHDCVYNEDDYCTICGRDGRG